MGWDSVFIPINERYSHWYSAYIDFKQKYIHIYDSWSETCLMNKQKPVLQRKNAGLMLVSLPKSAVSPMPTRTYTGFNVAGRTARS